MPSFLCSVVEMPPIHEVPSEGQPTHKRKQSFIFHLKRLDSYVSDEIETLLDGNNEQSFTGKSVQEKLFL